jgi:hypothetical protein
MTGQAEGGSIYSSEMGVPTMSEAEARIRRQAYFAWEADGRPIGRHLEHWERARIVQQGTDTFAATPSLNKGYYEGGVSAQPPTTDPMHPAPRSPLDPPGRPRLRRPANLVNAPPPSHLTSEDIPVPREKEVSTQDDDDDWPTE